MITDIDVSLRRVPPHDLEAEKAVLGSLLLDNSGLAEAFQVLDHSGADFYHTAHRVLFQVITSLVDQGTVADAVTVCDALRSAGDLDKVGGPVYLAEIMDCAISAVTVRHYAKIIRRKAGERLMITETIRLIDSVYNPAVDSEKALAEAQRTILSLFPFKEARHSQDSPRYRQGDLFCQREAPHGRRIDHRSTHRLSPFGQSYRWSSSGKSHHHRRSSRHGQDRLCRQYSGLSCLAGLPGCHFQPGNAGGSNHDPHFIRDDRH